MQGVPHRHLAAIAVAFAIAAVSFLGVQAFALPDDNTFVDAQPIGPLATDHETLAPLRDVVGPVSEAKPSELTPLDPSEHIDALLSDAVSLAECPEALEFLQQPHVQRFYDEQFGIPIDPDRLFFDECPTRLQLETSYGASVEQAGHR